jgi:hypothetical protein
MASPTLYLPLFGGCPLPSKDLKNMAIEGVYFIACHTY